MNLSAAVEVHRPSLALLSAEPLRAALEFARHRMVKASPSPPGDGHPVVIFPGLGADGRSVATLREHCRALGYAAFDWGQGFNTGPEGDLDTWLAELMLRVTTLLSVHEQPATPIGWSLVRGECRFQARLHPVLAGGTVARGRPRDSRHLAWGPNTCCTDFTSGRT